jgi:2-hydroxy-3-keto-5-methylthiopentenyl-1-phosphate phosphatase
MYDFDKTLCTKDMQEYAFIPALGMTSEDFWGEVNEMTDREEMDNILAYMFKMVEKAREKQIPVTRQTFHEMGTQVEYFDGVKTWFERINAFAEEIGVCVEHYIVSSGIKEIIEGTEIAAYFKKIYACEFLYDSNDTIQWPKFAVNYTAKTQFLFRINKGVLTVNSESARMLNRFTPENERPVPFGNMIYIGDGITDVPCMKLVKSNGGQSIAVYDREKGKEAAVQLQRSDRVNFIAPADYSPGSTVEVLVKAIIQKIQAVEAMQSYR